MADVAFAVTSLGHSTYLLTRIADTPLQRNGVQRRCLENTNGIARLESLAHRCSESRFPKVPIVSACFVEPTTRSEAVYRQPRGF